MDRNEDDMATRGHPENEGRELHHTHGDLRDIENAAAYANRTGQDDVTGAGERTKAEDRGPEHGAGATPRRDDARIHRGDDIGSGIHAKPADGVENADGRVDRGEDLGEGLRPRRAGEADPGNPLV